MIKRIIVLNIHDSFKIHTFIKPQHYLYGIFKDSLQEEKILIYSNCWDKYFFTNI